MAATYDPALGSDRDWVRFLIGDRDVTHPILQDENIDAILVEKSNKYCAAVIAAQAIVAQSKGLVEKAVDDLKLRWSDNAKSTYNEYIKSLQGRCAQASLKQPAVFRVLGIR